MENDDQKFEDVSGGIYYDGTGDMWVDADAMEPRLGLIASNTKYYHKGNMLGLLLDTVEEFLDG